MFVGTRKFEKPYQQFPCLRSIAVLGNLHCTCCLNTIQEPEVEMFNNFNI